MSSRVIVAVCGAVFMIAAPSVATSQRPTTPPAPPAPGGSRDTGRTRTIDTVRVTGRIDDLVGTAQTASEGYVGAAELRARPLTREGELLETVPGMIVTQHSGEGKANQYFVRGFNLDHGTDFQTRLEGMPLNMVTHGHGQGWTDLNFLVPELVEHLEYKLGVYHASVGDFGSAGAAEFHLVRKLDRPFTTAEFGANGLARFAGGASTRVGAGELLVGGEAKRYDGPWELREEVRKLSGLTRYSWTSGASQFSLLGMGYRNSWHANDQIPLRAVTGGLLSRFGQVDSTNGGAARRFSLSGSWRRLGSRSIQQAQLFGVYSDLVLFSNFTYFLDNPERGDQFSQTDDRVIVGGNLSHAQTVAAFGVPHALTVGVQTRADLIREVGLFRTERRERYETVRQDAVRQTGTGLWMQAESRWTDRFRSVAGLRGDGYTFDVSGDLAANAGRRAAAILSPKGSLIFTPTATSELYLSGGFGFHSNDARGTTITVDPVTRDSVSRVDPLVRSRGGEVGLRLSPRQGLRTSASAWLLDLDSELLFIGDAGNTEPTTGSRRYGITVANYLRPTAALALDTDISFANARFAGGAAGADRIPGALENVVAAGVTFAPPTSRVFGALRLRHFGAYPLDEGNVTRARSSDLVNANAGYRIRTGTRVQLSVLNLFDSRADDIQYRYGSRLRGEVSDGVEDVHFHPAEPRQVRVAVTHTF